MRNAIALLAGAIFGMGLFLSGMTDTKKVQGFLDFFGDWDPTLMFVMGGAVLPMIVAWRFSSTRAPLTGGTFPQPPSRKIDRSLIIGAILFGIGWGLVGLCPGPALASISYGGVEGWAFLIAMCAGMLFAPQMRKRLDTEDAKA